VELRLTLAGPGAIVIEVADTGIGLAPADHDRIFAPFVQVDDSIARRSEGSGLGLGIARRLVEAMGGSIGLDSRLGHGAVFRVALPLPEGQPVPVSAAATADLHGLAVLVADDNRANRKVLSVMLERMGATVTLAEDGAAALAAWAPGRFDALLLDINMPRLAGTDVIREIRRREAEAGLPRVPAHAVTANARPEQVTGYLVAGFDGCIAKPLEMRALAAALSGIEPRAQAAPDPAPRRVQGRGG
jgi:CheY-like chemotaxis protein